MVTDREREMSREFWSRRGQSPRSRSFSRSFRHAPGRLRIGRQERFGIVLGIAAMVAVVVFASR